MLSRSDAHGDMLPFRVLRMCHQDFTSAAHCHGTQTMYVALATEFVSLINFDAS